MRRTVVLLLLVPVLAAAACAGDESAAPATSSSAAGEPVAPATSSSVADESAATTTTSSVASASVVDGPGRYEMRLESSGAVRRYVVHVPEALPDPAPLVIVLHGFTGSPEDAERLTDMHVIGEEEGFVTVYPAARGLVPAWRADRATEDDADVRFVRDLVDAVAGELSVDRGRVFVAGMSNGGGMVDRLACEAADLIAAAGPVAGAFSDGECRTAQAVPMIAFHGTGDWIVPFYGFGGVLPSVPAWAADWSERNGCDRPVPPRSITDDVAEYTWEGCAAEMVLIVVEGGGHGWPGSTEASERGNSTMSVSASAMIWEFFSASS